MEEEFYDLDESFDDYFEQLLEEESFDYENDLVDWEAFDAMNIGGYDDYEDPDQYGDLLNENYQNL